MTDILEQLNKISIKQTIKDAGKKAKEALKKSSTLVTGCLEEASKLISKSGIPIVSSLAGIFSFGADRAKDAAIDLKFSGLADSIGDLQDGLNNVNAKVDAQGKALAGAIDGVKSELQGQLQQQGEKFDQEIKNLDTKIASLQGEQKKQAEEQKKALQRQKEELTREINEVGRKLTEAQNQLKKELDEFRNEVNERFAQHEQKILNNKRKIEEERLQREEEIRETHSKIKLTNTNLENLRKEKEQLEDELLNYQAKINQQTTETQQAFEDSQAEYERRTRIIETKIQDNEALLEAFQEDLSSVQREQAQSKLERQEIFEELQEQSDLLHFQKHQLNLVSQQMEEISEEVHERMDNIQKDHVELTTLAQETSQKVNHLTHEVKEISQKTLELEAQIQQNKLDTQKAKEEAQLANERLSNFLAEQREEELMKIKWAKMEKALELKAEETKLLATLKLLQETKKLIRPKPSQREWKVGVKNGTVPKDYPEPEDFPLVPNSYWERKFTGDQVKPANPHRLLSPEWFRWEEENYLPPEQTKFEPWGKRIYNENNEAAPLTTPDKRQEAQTEPNQTENHEEELFLTELETAKSEILTHLEEVQSWINNNLEELEQESTPPLTPYAEKVKQAQQKVSNKEQQLKQATVKARAIPIPSNKKVQQQAEQELQAAQQELNHLERNQEFAQELEDYQTQQQTEKKQAIEQNWTEIQTLSQQVLAEQPEITEETKEQDLNQKLEELTQQLQEIEQSQVASQKQMSQWMLFLIVFLLEYVVYKKNGVLGLVLLNVVLAILYYKKATILSYRHLWEKYFLIIGYVIGNTLAYSAPAKEKYKWPSVTAFNLIIAGIYAYTLYQQKQEQAKLETIFQEKTAQICQEHNITGEEWKTANIQPSLLSDYSPFSNSFTTAKEQQITNLQELIKEQQIIQQKALELQQQTELLQRSAEIESNLKEIQANLGEASMSWAKIKQRYPEFAERSTLLKELAQADKIINQNEATEPNQVFLTKLQRISAISNEESQLLSQLRLTLEQLVAISCQAYRFTSEEKEYLSDNYVNLTNEQQLSLLNAGINNLGIDNLTKKQIFVQLNHQLYQEKNNFGLTVKEKEQILRLLVNTLSLSKEQQNHLEKIGISFFNASEWVIDNAQKNQLLTFGLQRINLSENQKENLLNLSSNRLKTFSLSEEQKTILQSLAPLTREDKYSEDSLQLLNSLQLKRHSLSFLISEEIIPDPHHKFGEETSPYLPLKVNFLLGEQKVLKIQENKRQKQLSREEIQARKNSILPSLLEFVEKLREKEKDRWNDVWGNSYTLEEWVKMQALKKWQKDILLTTGLKTIPKYHFFELLKFVVEKINKQSWNDFLRENNSENAWKEFLEEQKNQPITINKTIWEKYVASQTTQQKNIFKGVNLEKLINSKIQQALSNHQPLPTENTANSEKPEEISEQIPQTPSTSRYDNLLNALNTEELARNKKKQEREAAKNKLEEAERQRREKKLVEKENKLKEEEERRAKERELADKEEQKRREAEASRQQALQAEQARIFQQKLKNIEAAKRRAEEALENQKKANELAEQKKQEEIAKLARENQQEQARLKKQAELIEEQKQKQLEAIALEDKEQRQLIEKRANEEKARIQQEMADKKRKNEEELKQKENALLRKKEEEQIEIDRLEKELHLQQTLGEELKQAGNRREAMLKGQKSQQQALVELRKQMYNSCLNFYLNTEEIKKGTRYQGNPVPRSGCHHLRDLVRDFPNMTFNLHFGDIYGGNWDGWGMAMKTFYKCVGSRFVNTTELKQIIDREVHTLTYLDNK